MRTDTFRLALIIEDAIKNHLGTDPMYIQTGNKYHVYEYPKKGSGLFHVRYKFNGIWRNSHFSTHTGNRAEAEKFAASNMERLCGMHLARQGQRQQSKAGQDFFRILKNYYTPDSKYLADDRKNNIHVPKAGTVERYRGVVENHIYPFLKGKIKEPKDLNRDIFLDLKEHLYTNTGKVKSASFYLGSFSRVCRYMHRKGLIDKLPFNTGKGGDLQYRYSYGNNPAKARAKDKLPMLPESRMFSVCRVLEAGEKDKALERVSLIAAVGIVTGGRNGELARLKAGDIVETPLFTYALLKNEKTMHHVGVKEKDLYRKLPLPPAVAKKLKRYILENGIQKDGYLFVGGIGEVEAGKYSKTFEKSASLVWRELDRERLKNKSWSFLKKDRHEKGFSFYSLRHTFQDRLTVKYGGCKGTLHDYFSGHSSANDMAAQYSHIGASTDDEFFRDYGNEILDWQLKEFCRTEKGSAKEKKLDGGSFMYFGGSLPE